MLETPWPLNEQVDTEWSGLTTVTAAVILRSPLGSVIFLPTRTPEPSSRGDPEMGRAGGRCWRLGQGEIKGCRAEGCRYDCCLFFLPPLPTKHIWMV